tara:strand:- start:682 stop:951 length:270 start_codon:yes stop_codon:yes gene_type:complete
MHKVKVKKNYNGLLSVRDYDCVKGVQSGGLAVVYGNKIVMEVDPESLKHALRNNKNKANRSKFPPHKEYKLVDFRFSKEENDDKQVSLL